MCGIAGIRKMGDTPILDWQLRMLACSLDYRGGDATGIALQQQDGRVYIYKDNVVAWNLVLQSDYTSFIQEHLSEQTVVALVHTRKWTKGSPLKPENNHPLSNGAAAIVHNGFVHNDDFLFHELQMERSAETDSDAIRGILDKEGITKKAIRVLNRISGSVAAAGVHPDFPRKVLLLRSGNPLVMGATPDMLLWASDKRTIYRALKPWVPRFNILMQVHEPQLSFVNMTNDSAWIIGDEGLEWHDEFRATGSGSWQRESGKSLEPSAKPLVERNTEAPGAAWLPRGPRFVRCPNTACGHMIELKPEQQSMPLHSLVCCDCKGSLAEASPASVN